MPPEPKAQRQRTSDGGINPGTADKTAASAPEQQPTTNEPPPPTIADATRTTKAEPDAGRTREPATATTPGKLNTQHRQRRKTKARTDKTARAARADNPAGNATLTAKAGTGKPQAANTGEPDAPERSQTRQPISGTVRAKAEARANEPNGTNRQAGAGDQPAPPGKARRAQTQPQDKGRATTPAPREAPKTETKPDITHPQEMNQSPRRHQPPQERRKARRERATGTGRDSQKPQPKKRKKLKKEKTPSKSNPIFQKSMWRVLSAPLLSDLRD